MSEYYPNVVDWLSRPQRRKLAAALLESLGRTHVDRMLASLVEVDRDSVSGLYVVIRSLESPRELVDRLSHLTLPVMQRFLEASRALSDAEFEPLLQAGLVSPAYGMRLAMLEHISEARAFRFLGLVRQRLHDADSRVRAVAIRWVYRLEDEGAVRELRLLLARSLIGNVERLAIYRTLEHLRGAGSDLLVQQFSLEHDEGVRDELVTLLAREGSDAALAVLRNSADDARTPTRVRVACRKALALE